MSTDHNDNVEKKKQKRRRVGKGQWRERGSLGGQRGGRGWKLQVTTGSAILVVGMQQSQSLGGAAELR